MMDAAEASYLTMCDNIHACELAARCNEAIPVSAPRASIPTHASMTIPTETSGKISNQMLFKIYDDFLKC